MHLAVSKNRGENPPKWMVKIMVPNPMNKWMIWVFPIIFGNTHLTPGWWQGQLSILERIRPASLVFGTVGKPLESEKKKGGILRRGLRCGSPPGWMWRKRKKVEKPLEKKNEWRFPPVFYRLLNEWWIRYCRLYWLMEKSMMLILRWLYSSRGHSSQFQFGTKQQFGGMILYQTWFYEDFVCIAIQKYTIDFRKPCTTIDLSGSFACIFFPVSEEQAFSASAERGHLQTRKKTSKFIDLTVWLKHQEIRNSQRIGCLVKLYIFCEGARKAHTFRQKPLWGKLGKL